MTRSDINPPRLGEVVFFHTHNGPRAALVANVPHPPPSLTVDLVVLCQGAHAADARETWAMGRGVVGFRGLIPHEVDADLTRSPLWWSRSSSTSRAISR